MKIAAVMINSEQPKVLGEFYTKVFGQPGWQDGEWYGFMAGAGLMVGPHSEVKGANDTPARLMVVLEADDVAAEFARLKDLGATVVAEPYQPDKDNDKIQLATVADPDGNYLQISTPWPA